MDINNKLTKEDATKAREDWYFVYNPDGTLNEHQVLAELHDYKFLLSQVPSVYAAVTCDRMSKPGYFARDVIAQAEQCEQERVDDTMHEVAKDVLDMIAAGHTPEEILKEFPPHDYS